MHFLHRPPQRPQRLAILAGTFNPPTLAHVAMAEAALAIVDEVLFALPRTLPHKEFHGATLEERADMLRKIVCSYGQFSAAVADGNGLYADIARHAEPFYDRAQIFLLCGRDAAERILTWTYDEPGFLQRMLRDFHLLVAPRGGPYQPPEEWVDAVHPLILPNFDHCSSTRIRESLASGCDVRDLVPSVIHEEVVRIYSR